MAKRKIEVKVEDINDGINKMMRRTTQNQFTDKVKHNFSMIEKDLNYFQSIVDKMTITELDVLKGEYNNASSASDRIVLAIAPCVLPLIDELQKISEDALVSRRMLIMKLEARYILEFNNGKKVDNSAFESIINQRYTALKIEEEVLQRLSLQKNAGDIQMKGSTS